MFKNEGNYQFKRLSKEIGLENSFSNGASYADLDNDGDLDVVINNINEPATILKNNTNNSNNSKNYIQFKFKPNANLKNTSGSKVIVYAETKTIVKQANVTRGFQSSSTHNLHFGLGDIKAIDSIQVIWPDNQIQTQKNVKINSTINLEKSKNTKAYVQVSSPKTKILTKFPYVHSEDDYLDYAREPLMPEKLSTEGPAVLYEDLDNDGYKDLFIGGARYQKPAYYKGSMSGALTQKTITAFGADERYEDVDAIAFDLENDGDLDVYVQSGGNDKPSGDPLLEDRVYINLGNGNFERLDSQLPATNGGCLAAADYNNDGFTDLFIGSRSIPGSYGMSPASLILKNTGQSSFTVVAQDEMGMVTDAQWADLNNDGFQDLVVVGDWMNILVLMNKQNGTFKYDSSRLGLNNTGGLWNTIEIFDVDANGFKDIIVGNVGENFKWNATKDQPVKLYISDFDNNKQPDPIIFYPYFDNYVPFANREALKSQLPYLSKKFTSNHDFSKIKTIQDLTGKSEKDIEIKKEIHELRSMIYLNSGDSLIGKPLGKKAQRSTIQDIFIDQNKLIYVGNYKGFVTELGNSDANTGGILSNFGKDMYSDHSFLQLPRNLGFRKIIHLENDTFLIISNNGIAYILEE